MTTTNSERLAHLAPGARELMASARNVNSQIGEDGIVEAILNRIGQRDRWCVEFGAWDGKYLSNTRRLIDEEGYNAVMIEANPQTYRTLAEAFKGNPRVHCINAFVGYGPQDNLDALLRPTGCPENLDFASIDIDGNDIHVWAATKTFRPKLVCIEYNPTIPTPVSFAQPQRPEIKWGSSLKALFELGQQKGYRLVCANEWNGFFVAEEYWTGEYAKSADELPLYRVQEPQPVYLFSGYDGTVLLSEPGRLNWHNITISQDKVQVLPRSLRKYPDDYSWYQRALLNAGRKVYHLLARRA